MAFLQKLDDKNYQFILCQISHKKRKKKLKNILLYKLAVIIFRFFKDIKIDAIQYYYIFIFQSGWEEDNESMKYYQKNGIKYLKYCAKNENSVFSNSSNHIIHSLVLDNKSFYLVDLIKCDEEFDISKDEKSEYSLTGRKRQKIDNISKTKYFFGSAV